MRLRYLALGLALLLATACSGSSDQESNDAAGTAATSPAAGAAADAPASARRGPSKGELKAADNLLFVSTDTDASGSVWVSAWGVAEALTKITPRMEVEPWIAARLDAVDPLTWRVTLRDDVTFHDGSQVDAAAVKASLERSMEKQPSTVDLIPAGTRFTAEGLTLTIATPAPVPLLPNSLAATNFMIKKVVSDTSIHYTGPFVLTEFTTRQGATLTAYESYRGGPPRIESVRVREVLDVATRVLALQSGDVDMAQALLPSDVAKLKGGGFEVHSFAFGRQNDIILNLAKPPLDDVAVRRAIALAIDRDALVKGVMDGIGTPAYGLAPDNLGVPGVLNTQTHDLAEARRILDAAGWRAGSDGIRVKDGRRLAFSLGSYAQRAELEPLSIAIKDQLKAAGIDASLVKYPDINSTVATNAFEATMWSYTAVPLGDLNRALAAMYTPSGNNKDRYSNPRVNDLYRQYIETADPAKRLEQVRQMQTLIGEDAPLVYVINPYQIVAVSKKVKHYTPHPLETYKLDADVSVE